jgi:hypothetical protein
MSCILQSLCVLDFQMNSYLNAEYSCMLGTILKRHFIRILQIAFKISSSAPQ